MFEKIKNPITKECLEKQKPFIYETKVFLEDIHFDQTAYHVSYIRMFDRARSEWLINLDSSNAQMHKNAKFLAISQMQIAFHAPAILENGLTVETKVHSLTGTGFTFSQKIQHQHKLLCSGEYKMVAVAQNDAGDGFTPHRLKDCLPKIYQKVHELCNT